MWDSNADIIGVRAHTTSKLLQYITSNLEPDLFLAMLSGNVDQKDYKSKILPLNSNQPEHFWIFRNIDFDQWHSADCSQVLWLSGPSSHDLYQVSSYILDLVNTDQTALYFFFSSTAGASINVNAVVVHSLLYQIVSSLIAEKKNSTSTILVFIRSLLNQIAPSEPWMKNSSLDMALRGLIGSSKISSGQFWKALKAVLAQQKQKYLIVIDGLDKAEHQVIGEIRSFITYVQERVWSKALLTSRTRADIKKSLDGLPCIEYDKERQGWVAFFIWLNQADMWYVNNTECLNTLHFENIRYSKISKEHKDSLEWLWAHAQYQAWSKSDDSRLLYVQGKPGSGKSTLTKYFRDNFPSNSSETIVANYFYSDREGESQRSHYGMLRSILYDILKQRETFFFHFQSEYRKCGFVDSKRTWSYESLRKVLLSIGVHPVPERLCLIIDAMDESDDNSGNRRDVLQVLFDLCSKKNGCIVKIFISSRPIGVLEHRNREFHNFIRLQDETRDDINNFARSFLGSDLNFTGSLLQRATNYITRHAQGVFVWVRLVKEELQPYAETGCSEKEIFEVLKSLPTELEDFYARILGRLGRDNQRNIRDATGMFEFVLFARRPLTVAELHHALAIRNDTAEFPSDESLKANLIEGIEKRIIHCGGNLLEIKGVNGISNYLMKMLYAIL